MLLRIISFCKCKQATSDFGRPWDALFFSRFAVVSVRRWRTSQQHEIDWEQRKLCFCLQAITWGLRVVVLGKDVLAFPQVSPHAPPSFPMLPLVYHSIEPVVEGSFLGQSLTAATWCILSAFSCLCIHGTCILLKNRHGTLLSVFILCEPG